MEKTYKITQKQKLDLRKIEKWASSSTSVTYTDWSVLVQYLGWILDGSNTSEYTNDHDAKLCKHNTYTEEERIVFNKIRNAYVSRVGPSCFEIIIALSIN